VVFENFHPASERWFITQFKQPTKTQIDAWQAIQNRKHTLVSAPTGSGKTLAAFYVAIDRLVKRGLSESKNKGVQVLYVSPLKALSNDIQKNLRIPLAGIAEQLFLLEGKSIDISVGVRTGDTPASERQKMRRSPPEILVTTPESLYLLLTSASGREMLSCVSTLIVDEIHAVLGDKRGSHLALSIERLTNLVESDSENKLQRIGLSATQNPIELVAKYLVGSSGVQKGKINCEIIDSGSLRKMDLTLAVPRSPLTAIMSNEVWEEVYAQLVESIAQHETTLIFVNTRRLSERLALALAEKLGTDVVSAHHGSMSKENRHKAEQLLKNGGLKVLVATASMELGIDIGSVDLVVQFSSPKNIAKFLQRVGRSGHCIDGTPKGILFPLTRDDLVECAALMWSLSRGELDLIELPYKPMDILAQQIIAEVSCKSMESQISEDAWRLDDLFVLMTRAYPYKELSRDEFDAVIKMISEGYASRRGRRGAHLHLDKINQKVRARRGANLASLTNGGAIPDMFEYQVVLDPENVVVGSLNEDFALEAIPGDVFTLGTHSWQMLRVDGLKVRVRDAGGMHPTVPFWFGEGPGRTRELSKSVSGLREKIANLLTADSANSAIQFASEEIGLPRSASVQLIDYLQTAMSELGIMPTQENLVIERFFDEVGDMHVVIHSPFGSRLNRAWGLALRKRFCKSFNFELQAAANEDSIVISLGSVHSFPLEDIFNYLKSATVREVLIQALLDAPMFEVRWRWNATRSLAIQRNRAGKRVPPQFQRMDAEDLIAHVFPDQIACQENIVGRREVPDHPLVNQTVYDCLSEAMDIVELEKLILSLENNEPGMTVRDLREPSVFSQEIINARPYAFLDDAPFEERRTNAIRNRSWSDPSEIKDLSLLDAAAISRVREEAWPQVRDSEELHDALITAGFITEYEFSHHGYHQWKGKLLEDRRLFQLLDHDKRIWIAAESLPLYKSIFPQLANDINLPSEVNFVDWPAGDALIEVIRARLESVGPTSASRLAADLSIDQSKVQAALLSLEGEGFVFQGNFSFNAAKQRLESTDSQELEWCERRLLQRIHKYSIDFHRKAIQPVSVEVFTEFIFDRHKLNSFQGHENHALRVEGEVSLQNTLDLLDGITAPAASWESDLFPTRVINYDPNWLDNLCIKGAVVWGRYLLPNNMSQRNKKRIPGPVKSMPLTFSTRQNRDIWLALARSKLGKEDLSDRSNKTKLIEEDLAHNGASFFEDILYRSKLLKIQLEECLAELVACGRVSSDSFSGMRALLTRNSRRPRFYKSKRGGSSSAIEGAGRWSLQDTFRRSNAESQTKKELDHRWNVLNEEQAERLIHIYLQRWGIITRALLEKESFSPPWRELLIHLRKMELRGVLRGGRFIAGLGGEQFSLPETVDAIRKFKKARESAPKNKLYCLSAADPLNLMNLTSGSQKLPRLQKNRVLYQGGIPIAVLDSGRVKHLREFDSISHWDILQMLTKKNFKSHRPKLSPVSAGIING